MNNYIVAVPDAGVVAVLLFVPVLRLDIALGADTGGGGGRGLVTGGLVTGGGKGHITGEEVDPSLEVEEVLVIEVLHYHLSLLFSHKVL